MNKSEEIVDDSIQFQTFSNGRNGKELNSDGVEEGPTGGILLPPGVVKDDFH